MGGEEPTHTGRKLLTGKRQVGRKYNKERNNGRKGDKEEARDVPGNLP
jgi:hypothetical protein